MEEILRDWLGMLRCERLAEQGPEPNPGTLDRAAEAWRG